VRIIDELERGAITPPPPWEYRARLCRAIALLAVGAAMHVPWSAGPDPQIALPPLEFVHSEPRSVEPAIVVDRSTVFAREIDELNGHGRFIRTSATGTVGFFTPSHAVALTSLASDSAAEPVPTATSGDGPAPESAPDLRAPLPSVKRDAPVTPTAPAAEEIRDRPPDERPALKLTSLEPVRFVPAATPAKEENEEELVRRLLDEYTGAFERLDVGAAKAVWPTVDDKALKRAFEQLASQRLTLESCGIRISGSTANARCRGSATYHPRIGTRSVQIASREWTFDLSKQDTAWRIVNTFVR
jgi:hypothetical protein